LQLLKSVNVRESDKPVSFYVISLFTNASVEEVPDIIRTQTAVRWHTGWTFGFGGGRHRAVVCGMFKKPLIFK